MPAFGEKVDLFEAECLFIGLNVLEYLAMAWYLSDIFFEDITKKTDPQLRLLPTPPSRLGA